MHITIINNQNKIDLNLKLIEQVSTYISDKFDKDKNCKVNIIFVGKPDIRKLNKRYRGKDSVTDVLSFSYLYDRDSGETNEKIEQFGRQHGFYIMGEIVICPETAEENAKIQKNWNFNLEIFLLIIHGFLHLYDYDHEIPEEKEKMFDIQDSILEDVRLKFGL